MNLALLGITVVLTIAWVPVLVRFFRNWRARSNPISLAIFFLVAGSVYQSFVPLITGSVDPVGAALVVQAVNAVTCLFFHISFSWARKRWTDRSTDRTNPETNGVPAGRRRADFPFFSDDDDASSERAPKR